MTWQWWQILSAMALAATGQEVGPTLAGSAFALLIRLISGLPPHWEMLITLGIMAAGPLLPCGKNTAVLMVIGAVSVLPTAIAARQSEACGPINT